MKLATFAAILLLGFACSGCATGKKEGVKPPELPKDWERMDVDGVSFALPPDAQETPVQGLPGIFRQFKTAELQVNMHSGDFASTLKEFESASGTYEWIKIDGKQARGTSAFIDGKAVDGLYFPEPGKDKPPFSLLVVSTTPAARQQAMLVLQSVKLK